MKRTLVLLLICLLIAPVALAADSPMEPEAQASLAKIRDEAADYAAANQPKVVTLENGVKIQRTPGTPDTIVAGNASMFEYMSYNMRFLKADRRGCGACHTDLAAVVDNLKGYPHLKVSNTMGIDFTVQQCMICHANYGGSMYDEPEGGFGSLMHMLHNDVDNPAFEAMGGDCWSCHYATEDGKGLQLWDNVKYDVLRGITPIEASAVESSFVWNQDKVLDADALLELQWFHDPGAVRRQARSDAGLKPDPENDGVYDQWEIEVTGDVENPFTMTISEMIEKIGLEEDVMTINCGVNVMGGPWIGNFKVKGFNMKTIMEYAGVKEGVTDVVADSFDGTYYRFVSSLENIEKNDVFLVLEVAGEPLPYHSGYPVQLWVGSVPAWTNGKEIARLTFGTFENLVPESGWTDENNMSFYKTCVGVFNLREGQIIDASQPYTFEGYAHAWENPVTAVEFSFDGGTTWVHCDTPEMNPKRWVAWEFTWTPPAEGAYTLMVRGVCEDGTRPAYVQEFLINAQ